MSAGWLRSALAAVIALTTVSAASLPAIAADLVGAAIIRGSGKVIICRNWVAFDSCTKNHVVLPQRIAVGETVELRYGSDPKRYAFHVALIRLRGAGCVILIEGSDENEAGARIDVARCIPALEPPTKSG